MKSEKNEVEVEVPNLTLAEILRVYLSNDSSVDFVAWRREHLTKNPVFKIKAKDVKASVKSACDAIIKDLDSISIK